MVELLRLDLADVGLGDHIDQASLSACTADSRAMGKTERRYNEWRRIQHLVGQLSVPALGHL